MLSNGGLRSLVATAAVLAESQRPRVAIIHVRDGRPGAEMRREQVHRQAEHFSVRQVIELTLPRHTASAAVPAPDDDAPAPLMRPRIVLAAVAHLMQTHAQRLIWPVQFNGDFATIAAVTEQLVLLRHMIELDPAPPVDSAAGQPAARPAIETPFIDLTDRQLIELGGQLQAPWHLAWSCQFPGEKPCRVCPPCRRRHAAFNGAGIVDPIEQLLPT